MAVYGYGEGGGKADSAEAALAVGSTIRGGPPQISTFMRQQAITYYCNNDRVHNSDPAGDRRVSSSATDCIRLGSSELRGRERVA